MRSKVHIEQIGKFAKCAGDLYPGIRTCTAQSVQMHPRLTNMAGKKCKFPGRLFKM